MKLEGHVGVWSRFWDRVTKTLHSSNNSARRESVRLRLEALQKRVDAQQGDPKLTLSSGRRHQ